jgi:organic hydroperoxide reductase OsmC/OhrA
LPRSRSATLLWYLHLAAAAGVVVTDYVDHAGGTMVEESDGAGRFVEAVLRPAVTVADASMITRAQQLHDEAAAKCFIARSVNFPIRHQPTAVAAAPGRGNSASSAGNGRKPDASPGSP